MQDGLSGSSTSCFLPLNFSLHPHQQLPFLHMGEGFSPAPLCVQPPLFMDIRVISNSITTGNDPVPLSFQHSCLLTRALAENRYLHLLHPDVQLLQYRKGQLAVCFLCSCFLTAGIPSQPQTLCSVVAVHKNHLHLQFCHASLHWA